MKNDDMISRAAAIGALSTPCDKRYRHGVWETCLDNIETAIRNIPAVDAVPVIRCRDCKHSIENAKHIDVACERSYDPDFYCAAGERRDSE